MGQLSDVLASTSGLEQDKTEQGVTRRPSYKGSVGQLALKGLRQLDNDAIEALLTGGPQSDEYPDGQPVLAFTSNISSWLTHGGKANPTDINKLKLIGKTFDARSIGGVVTQYKFKKLLAGGGMNSGVFVVTGGESDYILKFPLRDPKRELGSSGGQPEKCPQFVREVATLKGLTECVELNGGQQFVPKLIAEEVQFGDTLFQCCIQEVAVGESLDIHFARKSLGQAELVNLKEDIQNMLSWFARNRWMADDWKWDHVFYHPQTREISRIDFGASCERADGEEPEVAQRCMNYMLHDTRQSCYKLQEEDLEADVACEHDLFGVRRERKSTAKAT